MVVIVAVGEVIGVVEIAAAAVAAIVVVVAAVEIVAVAAAIGVEVIAAAVAAEGIDPALPDVKQDYSCILLTHTNVRAPGPILLIPQNLTLRELFNG